MRTFNFGLLAVLSCIAMIGATPVGNDAPVEAIGRRQPMPVPPMYVPLQQFMDMEVLTRLKMVSPALASLLNLNLFLTDATLMIALEVVIALVVANSHSMYLGSSTWTRWF
jgi:hypothetical protein